MSTVVTFIRCLVEFSNTLESLPEERYLTMRMSYYDDKTPEDYQPEFFQEGHDVIKVLLELTRCLLIAYV